MNDDIELAAGGRRRRRAPRARRRRPRRRPRGASVRARCSARRATTTSSAPSARSRAGADYVAFGSRVRLADQTRRGARAARAPRRGAAASASRSSRSAASRSTTPPHAIAAGADVLAVISALFDAARRRRARARVQRPVHEKGRRMTRNDAAVRARAGPHPRRRELAGARVPRRRRHAALLRARARARTSGTPTARATSTTSAPGDRSSSATPIPQVVAAVRETAAQRALVRRADRARGRAGRAALRGAALAWSWCASCPRAPRRR